jgi:hypothetical protein
MPAFSVSSMVSQVIADGLGQLQQNVTAFVQDAAASEIVESIRESVKPGGFLSGSWGGTTLGEQDKKKLEASLATAGISGDMAKASAIIFEALGGKTSSLVVDTLTKYLVAPVINTAAKLVKGICAVIQKAAQGIKWGAPKLAEVIERNLKAAGAKIQATCRDASTACKEAYNKAVVKTQELGARLERKRSVSKGIRSVLASGLARTFGKNTPEGRKTLRDINNADQRNKMEAERKYEYRLQQIAKDEAVRAAALGIKGGKAEKHGEPVKTHLNVMAELKANAAKKAARGKE